MSGARTLGELHGNLIPANVKPTMASVVPAITMKFPLYFFSTMDPSGVLTVKNSRTRPNAMPVSGRLRSVWHVMRNLRPKEYFPSRTKQPTPGRLLSEGASLIENLSIPDSEKRILDDAYDRGANTRSKGPSKAENTLVETTLA